MEPLSSMDASFILTESPGLPMHITSVSIYDPSTVPGGADTDAPVRFKQILQLYQNAIYEVPLLRRRIVKVFGDLEFPQWIEDPDFDLEFHVRHIALPEPGDWRQFYIQLARLHSRELDMSRPLWETYVIEGLDNLEGIPQGSFAIVQKIHHSAMDGAGASKLFMALNQTSPDVGPSRRPSAPLLREDRPNQLELGLRSVGRTLRRPSKLAGAIKKTARSIIDIKNAEKSGELTPKLEPAIGHFNGETSPHRSITSATFDFEAFRRLRKAVPGATVNDLALTVCGGALRRYVAAKGESVDAPLIAQVPVDIRSREQQLEGGNVIATIDASCGSDIEDPLERLRAVKQSTDEGKKRMEVMGPSLTHEMSEALGPIVTKAAFALIFKPSTLGPLGSIMPNPPNFVLSNMPGPREPVYFCGAQLVWGTGLGPLMPTAGLFVTVNSVLDKLVYGITACRHMMPDPEFFNECLLKSFEETEARLGQELAAGSKGRTRKPKRKKSA